MLTASGPVTIVSGGSFTLSGNGDNVTFFSPVTNTGAITVGTGETVNINGLLTNNSGGLITMTGGTFTAVDVVNGGAILLNGANGVLSATDTFTVEIGGSIMLSGSGDKITSLWPADRLGPYHNRRWRDYELQHAYAEWVDVWFHLRRFDCPVDRVGQ